MVADARPAGAGDLGHGLGPFPPRRFFIGAKPGKRRARQFGLGFADLANQLEEQGQRPRRVFMLQCTLVCY